MARERPYLKHAILNQYNLILAAGALLFSLIDQSIYGVVFFLGLQMVYLSVVPGTAWFRRWVDAKYEEEAREEARKKREELLTQMAVPHRQKFEQLESLVDKIRENLARQDEVVRAVLEESLGKAARLTSQYVRLAIAHMAYYRYLSATDRNVLAREIASLEKSKESATARVKELQSQRLEIAKKRAERWDRARENIEVTQHQLATIEELLALMYEQSIAPKDPERMNADLDRFMSDLEGNEGTVREVAELTAEADAEAELAELELGREAANERKERR